jgi:hypothetical protein
MIRGCMTGCFLFLAGWIMHFDAASEGVMVECEVGWVFS